jgi:hypothetical protein
MVPARSDCVVEVLGTGGVQPVLNSAPYLSVEAHARNDGAGDGTLSSSNAGGYPIELAFSASGASIDEVSLSGSVGELTIDASRPQG